MCEGTSWDWGIERIVSNGSGVLQVLKVGSMQVEMVERVQLGSTITATVWLFDSGENALEVPNSELLELRPVIESNLATITKVQTDSADGQVKFNITGIKLGTTVCSLFYFRLSVISRVHIVANSFKICCNF